MPEWGEGLLASLPVGSRIAGYRLEEQIGRGGMAVVFRALDERLQRQVALKILVPALTADEAFRQRFIRESRSGAAVDHPHIIPVFEAGEADGVLFIAMRYVPGGDARTLVHRVGPLSAARAAGIISAVASALDAAHAAGLVHRDVKPANMLIDARPGRPDHVYLSDFGLTKGALASLALTGIGQFLGTPDYSAPEQIEGGPVDGRTDEYALGCAAFELLSGALPFSREHGMAVIYAQVSAPPPPLTSVRPDLPPAADIVLARAMAKAPDDRYPNCREFAEALRATFGLAPYDSDPKASSPPTVSSGRDRPKLALSATYIDLGLLSLNGQSPEQRVRLGNSGGGFLNARAATSANWLKLRQAGDELVVAVDTSAVGEHEGTVRVDSDGGSAVIRVLARVAAESAPAREIVVAHPESVLKTPIGLQPTPPLGPAVTPAPSAPVDAGGGAVTPIAATEALDAPRARAADDSESGPGEKGRTIRRRSLVIAVGAVIAVIGVVTAIIVVSSPQPRRPAASPQRTTAAPPTPASPRLLWAAKTGDTIEARPAVVGGTVYFGSWDHKVYALDAANGHVRWTYTTGDAIRSLLTVVGGTVYVGSWDHKLYALDAANGHLRWAYTTKRHVNSGPAVVGGTVYFGDVDHKVYALDAATGHVRWTYTTGGPIYSSPAVVDGTVYIGSRDFKLYALDAATGRLRWAYTTGGPVPDSPAVVNGIVYVDSKDDRLYALNAATGHLRWSYTTVSYGLSSPTVADNTVYVGSMNHKVYALDAATGHLRWAHTVGGGTLYSPAVAGTTVYIGSTDHHLYALSTGS